VGSGQLEGLRFGGDGGWSWPCRLARRKEFEAVVNVRLVVQQGAVQGTS
jgi:hypothetical protein